MTAERFPAQLVDLQETQHYGLFILCYFCASLTIHRRSVLKRQFTQSFILQNLYIQNDNVLTCVFQDKQYVGFATLPNQVHRKSVKKGFDFTLMVAGLSEIITIFVTLVFVINKSILCVFR